MNSATPFPIVVVVPGEEEYAAIADALFGRHIVEIEGLVVERGSVLRASRQFDVLLVSHALDERLALYKELPGAPHVIVEVAQTQPLMRANIHYEVVVEGNESPARRWLGAGFLDRLRIASRQQVEFTGRPVVAAGALRLRVATITSRGPLTSDLVVLRWAGSFFHNASGADARVVFELTLSALATAPQPTATTNGTSSPTRVVPPEVTGYLSRISLDRVKSLDALTWELPAAPGFYVMLGQNASGKTGLLRAITAALLPHDEVGALRVDWAHWVRQGQADARCELHFADDATTGWRITNGAFEKTGHTWTGFSAAYGPFRSFTGGDVEYVREFESQRRLLRHLSLFSERVALSDALKWLQDLEFRQSKQMPGAEIRDDLVTFINETGLLPAGVALSRIDPDGVWFRDANGATLPADELSDGYRAILSLALDLLRHLAADLGKAPLFEKVDDVLVVAAEGIVVIDEIDAHLHATWQQRIGHWFKKHFPRFQFLVATHSAIVCQAADSVLLLPDPGTGAAPRMLTETELARVRYGDLLDAFDTGAFGEGVTRSEESRRKLERLAELNTTELQRPLTDAERVELRELRHVMPSSAFTTDRDAS